MKRVVPQDASVDDPPELAELIQAVPGAFVALPPIQTELRPSEHELALLDRSLAHISHTQPHPENTIEIDIGPNGSIEFAGFTFMLDDKLVDDVRELLERHALTSPARQRFARDFAPNRSTVVHRAACDLVLSMIADRMARRQGLISITDKPLDYALTGLNGLDFPLTKPANSIEGSLTAAFASVLIPAGIEGVSLADYSAIRHSYAGIRAAFSGFVEEFSRIRRLQLIQDPSELDKRIQAAATALGNEFIEFKRTNFARKLGHLSPFVIGGLLPLVTDFDWVPEKASWTATTAAFAVKIIERVFARSESYQDQVFRLASGLEADLKALPGMAAALQRQL